MSDCSPLRLAENGNSPNQSSGDSQGSQRVRDGNNRMHQHPHLNRPHNMPTRRVHRTTNHRNEGFVGLDNDPDGEDPRRVRSQSESAASAKSESQLRYDAKNVIELFIPVSLCMIIVVGTMRATDSYRYSSQTVVWYAHMMFTDQTVDTGTRVWHSFANAFIMLIMIVVMTTALILLYKFRCYKVIHGWLILSSLILLFMFAIMYIAELLKIYNVPLDIYTLMIFIWNFGVVGMISIHWKGPLLLQQGYLIIISALLALVFIRSLPDWTTWTVLGIISVWDLVAVLCPRGPLRILVETAQERNEPIFPALIYSSTVLWEFVTYSVVAITMAKTNQGSSNHEPSRSHNRRQIPDNQPSSSRRSRPKRPAELTTPSERSQPPLEIQYDGGAQPPEVDIIQPNVSGTSDDWSAPVVRTHRITREGNRTDSADVRSRPRVRGPAQEADPVQSTINFRPNEGPQNIVQIEEERGVKLGLGDFIFFSLLVGKASSYGDWIITLSCYVAILVGLCLTLSLLAVFRKALPALPISIAFGMCSFFMSYTFAKHFAEVLAINQVFV